MNGNDLKAWRKTHGYKSQAMLQSELGVSLRTVGAWEASKEKLPRLVILALTALECDPALRTQLGRRETGAAHIVERHREQELAPTLDDWRNARGMDGE